MSDFIRSEFEKWESDNGKWPRSIERSGEGYRLITVQSDWTAWKACASAMNLIKGREDG